MDFFIQDALILNCFQTSVVTNWLLSNAGVFVAVAVSVYGIQKLIHASRLDKIQCSAPLWLTYD